MAAPARYHASIDLSANTPAVDDDVDPKPANHFRRSVSIFSRRGTETPEALEAMPSFRPMSERQTSWMGRRKDVCRSLRSAKASSPGAPQGTILNAVPPAKTIQMTPLEEEMATSPNDEIRSAISEHAPTLSALTGSSSLPSSTSGSVRSNSTTALADRSTSLKRKDTNSRIGVWVDGVVHWDEEARRDYGQDTRIEVTGFTLYRPVTAGAQLRTQLARKPHLSVTIPGESLVNDGTLSNIILPKPHHALDFVAPASTGSNFTVSPPPIVVDGVNKVSPLEGKSGLPLTLPDRPTVPPHSGSERSQRSSTSSSILLEDASSCRSRRSSATSVEIATAGAAPCSKSKGLPPLAVPQSEASDLPSREDLAIGYVEVPAEHQLRPRKLTSVRLMSELAICDQEFMQSSPYTVNIRAASPTLSQAEKDLEYQLGTTGVHRKDSVRDVMQPPARAPTIPKRSRRREWKTPKRASYSANQQPALGVPVRRRSDSHAKHAGHVEHTPALRKNASISYSSNNIKDLGFHSHPQGTVPRSSIPSITIDDGHAQSQESKIISEPPETQLPNVPTAAITSTSAEHVLLNILSSLNTVEDLFNTALLNKGMYRVFKENEMQLLSTVTFNHSAAAWELREWSPPGRNDIESSKSSSLLEHTPKTYMRCHHRDVAIIERLKTMILQNCQTFIRRETTFALTTPSHPHASRFNDAFWRIWCFCKIFGCDKGREDDITGQLDWLKGGLLANNQGCVATVNTNLDFEMSSVLINAPEHFASANIGGLYATQLFDMTEIWTCMTVLLQGYSGRIEKARKYGVFDGCDVEDGDNEHEEQLLEEWLSYLLTLGPDVVLEMAELASHSSAGFRLARANGWTHWTSPTYNGSRATFLKEPVAKSYEEQIAAAKFRMQDPIETEKKERSRKRVATLAAEIRLRRQSSDYKRLPLIDMKHERAMSVASRRSSTTGTRPMRTDASRGTSRQASSSVTTGSVYTSGPSGLSPTSLWGSPRRISPIIEDRVESFNRMSLRDFAAGAENSAELAVNKLLDMGFTAAQAKDALRATDMGDGLRLDRAVEMLLRQA